MQEKLLRIENFRNKIESGGLSKILCDMRVREHGKEQANYTGFLEEKLKVPFTELFEMCDFLIFKAECCKSFKTRYNIIVSNSENLSILFTMDT
jgi:hypothetical protein